MGKASVRVCAPSSTQVAPPGDSSLLKTGLCKFCSSQSCLFAFQCQDGGCGQEERTQQKSEPKGLVLVFEDGTKSSKAPNPVLGIVEMFFLKETWQMIDSAARGTTCRGSWVHESISPPQIFILSFSRIYRLSLKLSLLFERWLKSCYVCQKEVESGDNKDSAEAVGFFHLLFWLKSRQAEEI